MPTPCPPNQFTDCHGPFRIGFTIELPYGYTDKLISWDEEGIVQSSELQHVLTTAWNDLPPDLAVSLGGRQTETVFCGTDPLVFKGSALQREPEDGPDHTDAWVVQVWVYAPDAPTSEWLDYPYVASLWANALREVSLPGTSRPATLTITDVVYLIDNRFTGVLPPDYSPRPPTGESMHGMSVG